MKTRSEAKASAIRVLMQTLDIMGFGRVTRKGDKITCYKFLPHLGENKNLVKYTFTINDVQLWSLEKANGIDARNEFDTRYPRQIKEYDE